MNIPVLLIINIPNLMLLISVLLISKSFQRIKNGLLSSIPCLLAILTKGNDLGVVYTFQLIVWYMSIFCMLGYAKKTWTPAIFGLIVLLIIAVYYSSWYHIGFLFAGMIVNVAALGVFVRHYNLYYFKKHKE